MENVKCVMIIDQTLPLGVTANTAAILGITLGKLFPETVGGDVRDKSGGVHPGIIEFPVPILKGTPELIGEVRQKLSGTGFEGVAAVDFSETAQSCKTYAEFTEKMSQTEEKDLRYMGIALFGEKKKINKLTGNIPLLK
ncbi:MAG: DUF2000 domain-containing protein [Ruminococcus sp.]|nr:DUF2000 domain-containing protein [Ruminococcus sp.]MCM1380629.1 DUF2000 domain-containing protein [Muribaculaceae bacterium]MCM1478371.1 DUF2000 domain-containing protein [Muribaculaceae bacterium]